MFGRDHKGECERVREKFSSFLDGYLNQVEEDAVRYHIQRCERCRSEVESIDATRELLRWMPEEDVPRSFLLPEVWRGWVRDPLSVRSMGWLRVALATVMVAFVVLLAADFSGAFYTKVEPSVTLQSPTASSGQVGSSEQTPQASSGSEEPSDSTGLNEAKQPGPSDSQGSGEIAGLPESADETPSDVKGVSTLPEAQEAVSSEPYWWLHPSEIVAFAVLVILGAAYLWAWQKRRRLSHK